ncbi:MAG: hypothetical protein H7Z10_03410 [Gemmatimonadaceae bacterium]|nr:hypothetical protein [Acetobacteraceae bacterium]
MRRDLRLPGIGVATVLIAAAAPEGITFAPQIIVQSPPPDWIRTWLPVCIAGLSALIAAGAAWISWRNQVFGFAKDAAALKREVRSRNTTSALLAFENSVARPIGMALDLIERLSIDLSRLRPVPPGEGAAALETYVALLAAEHGQGLRLCREADGSLAALSRPPIFARAFGNQDLDDSLLAAAGEILVSAPGSGPSALDTAVEAIVRTKVDLRRLLEAERAQEAARWLGSLETDPFFTEVQRWLPKRLRSRSGG